MSRKRNQLVPAYVRATAVRKQVGHVALVAGMRCRVATDELARSFPEHAAVESSILRLFCCAFLVVPDLCCKSLLSLDDAHSAIFAALPFASA